MAVLRYLAITLTLLFLSGCEIDFDNDKESDPAPKRISGDLVVFQINFAEQVVVKLLHIRHNDEFHPPVFAISGLIESLVWVSF
ncbi:hypothetical protein A3759_07450 [Thalassolituus sp. HI0120]|nr:hypothetical protein A3759_19445 [Thalassolituus sp. HI0120]KZZ46050.1 hypothetical protein A3759_07450 [Thalassolituus sp. HI0120]